MISTRCWLLLALFLSLSGCLHDDTADGSLEELGGAALVVEITPTEGLLRLGANTVRGATRCLRFTGGKAFLDGKELEQTERGGGWTINLGPLGGNSECKSPTWRFDPPAATDVGVREFEVADGTGRL